jgi:hypothetical protein
MKNPYTIVGDITEIYINCKGKRYTILIDTDDLDKGLCIPQHLVRLYKQWQHIRQNISQGYLYHPTQGNYG